MSEQAGAELDDFLDASLEKAARIENALGHLAKAIELGLVDVALDPAIAGNGSRERFVQLGQKLAELSGLAYELVVDISTTTGIPIEAETIQSGAPLQLEAGEQPALPAAVEPEPVVEPSREETQVPKAQESAVEPEAVDTPPAAEASTEENDLYARIVDPSKLPEMRPVEENEAISASILTDTSIKIGQREIKLRREELFLFNALLTLRDKPRSSKELRALGFAPEGKAPTSVAFGNNIKSLSEKLNRAAGKEIVKKIGERLATQYCVNPKFVLDDVRGKEADDSKKN